MNNRYSVKEFGLFKEFQPQHVERIAREAQIKTLGTEEILYRPGDAADMLYGLLDGSVGLSLDFREKFLLARPGYEEALAEKYRFSDKPVRVGRVQPGYIFGWSAIGDPPRRSLKAQAETECQLACFPIEELNTLFETDPQLGYHFMRRIAGVVMAHLQSRTEALIDAWGEAFGTETIQDGSI